MSKPDGGPAFPSTVNPSTGDYINDGMSLRDWFAGQALTGILASPDRSGSVQNRVELAWRIAGAMLQERERS